MGKFWKLIGAYDAESTTYTAVAGTKAPSPYTPTSDTKLIGLRVVIGRGAATCLINSVQFRLSCSKFAPENQIEAGAVGGGIATAPAFQPAPIDWPVDQEIKAGTPIVIEARNNTADTPVAVEAELWGCFEG